MTDPIDDGWRNGEVVDATSQELPEVVWIVRYVLMVCYGATAWSVSPGLHASMEELFAAVKLYRDMGITAYRFIRVALPLSSKPS